MLEDNVVFVNFGFELRVTQNRMTDVVQLCIKPCPAKDSLSSGAA